MGSVTLGSRGAVGTIRSPLGDLLAIVDDLGVRELRFPGDASPLPAAFEDDHPLLPRVRAQLDEYFAGTRNHFDLPLAPAFGTPFQRRVWKALETIPYAETRSYQELAEMVRSPKAARAVGAANARNPLPIVVPCHRVIGKSGLLVGFGGGLDAKQTLLELERRHAARSVDGSLFG